MEDTIRKLVAIVNSSDRENTDYSIAMGLLKNIDCIANSSIEQMAEHCYTSTASLSRFCRKMGFQNYVLFKNEFNKPVSHLLMSLDHGATYVRGKSEKNVIDRLVDRRIKILQLLKLHIAPEQIERIINEMNRADAIYLICSGAQPDNFLNFQYRMLLANKYVDYRNSGWIQSYSTEPFSVRIHINLLTVEAYSSLDSKKVGIDISDRVDKTDRRLIDVKIIITDELPVVSTDNPRHMDDGKYGSFILETLLDIISIAYSEKFVLSKRDLSRKAF
ncbi:hypothetical protein LJC55_00440 [Eubacteriales bacterium OttesenSCG-928-N14]|nr:hypothetical protein [Eubacteriales bacterium OttesenSCG-928-N14]